MLIVLIMYLHTLFHHLFLFHNKFTEARYNFYLILYNIVVYSIQICPPMSSLINNLVTDVLNVFYDTEILVKILNGFLWVGVIG